MKRKAPILIFEYVLLVIVKESNFTLKQNNVDL